MIVALGFLRPYINMLRKHTDNADSDNFDNSDSFDLMDGVMGKTFVVLNSTNIRA